MRVGPDAATVALELLRPAEGQVHDLIVMLESAQDCAEVVTMLITVSQTLDRAWFRLLATQVQHCLATSSSSDERGRNLQQLERLFCALS